LQLAVLITQRYEKVVFPATCLEVVKFLVARLVAKTDATLAQFLLQLVLQIALRIASKNCTV
jgi:hypothetical protein